MASNLLSKSIKIVQKDWQEKYGIEPLLIETFVDLEKYKGTCYEAANFINIGSTKGWGRQDINHEENGTSIKAIYVIELNKNARDILCEGQELKEEEIPQPKDWIEKEFWESNLGDIRLKNRLYEITRDFFSNPTGNIPQVCQSQARTKATYRFFDNKAVKMDEILSGHIKETIKRMKSEKVGLAIQDTTSIDYTSHPMTEGIGPIASYEIGTNGLLLHDTLAFTTEGTPLGILDAQVWARDKDKSDNQVNIRDLPIEEKESNKWLESYGKVNQIQEEMVETQIINICDREGDIYELY